MSELPSLHRLRLAPVGMDASSSEDLEPPSKRLVRELAERAVQKVVREIVSATHPYMLCLQDQNGASLSASRHVLAFLKAQREVPSTTQNQLDDEEDGRRYNAAKDAGRTPPVVVAYKPAVLAQPAVQGYLEQVKARLRSISRQLGRDLGAQVWEGNPIVAKNNLGWVVTYTDRFGEDDYFRFHQDMRTLGIRSVLPPRAKDWLMLTMVYYMLDPEGEARTRDRLGQGSTLYNMQNEQWPKPDTEVAFCPLKNGSITIFDGTRYHQVGPNYGIGRGAVIHKVVLHKPEHAERVWAHEVWWRHAQQSLLRMTGVRDNALSMTPFSLAALSKTLEVPADAAPSASVE